MVDEYGQSNIHCTPGSNGYLSTSLSHNSNGKLYDLKGWNGMAIAVLVDNSTRITKEAI